MTRDIRAASSGNAGRDEHAISSGLFPFVCWLLYREPVARARGFVIAPEVQGFRPAVKHPLTRPLSFARSLAAGPLTSSRQRRLEFRAPEGRSNPAQANGLGQGKETCFQARALKGRPKRAATKGYRGPPWLRSAVPRKEVPQTANSAVCVTPAAYRDAPPSILLARSIFVLLKSHPT